MASCPRCAQTFVNALQLGSHIRACNVVQPAGTITQPAMPPTGMAGSVLPQTASNHPFPPTSLCALAQRAKMVHHGISHRCWGNTIHVDTGELMGTSAGAREYRDLQEMWIDYCNAAHSCCTIEFWDVFSAVRTSTTRTRDKVLTTVKKLVPGEAAGHRWPGTTRVLRDRVCHLCLCLLFLHLLLMCTLLCSSACVCVACMCCSSVLCCVRLRNGRETFGIT